MIGHYLRLIKRQIDVQLRVRTFNFNSLLLYLLQPAIFSGVGMMLSRIAGLEKPDLVYTILGSGFLGMWSGVVFSSGYDILRDRRDGTLEIIVGSPTSLNIVEAIRTISNVGTGLISMIAALLGATLVFNYSLSKVNIIAAIISLLFVILSMWTIGILLYNFFVWSRLSGKFVDLLEFPIAIICGFMFPVSILPYWVQACSTLFPLRWAIESFTASVLGEANISILLSKWFMAGLLSLVYWYLAHRLYEKVNYRIRVTGEMSSI